MKRKPGVRHTHDGGRWSHVHRSEPPCLKHPRARTCGWTWTGFQWT